MNRAIYDAIMVSTQNENTRAKSAFGNNGDGRMQCRIVQIVKAIKINEMLRPMLLPSIRKYSSFFFS